MRILETGYDLKLFFDQLRSARYWALLLDYDGTLAPFSLRRDEAIPYPGVVERLKKLSKNPGGRTIIISGRSIVDIKKLLPSDLQLEVWGCHGAERMYADGSFREASPGKITANSLCMAFQWAEQQGFGATCERKPTGLAFHWRGLSDSEAECIRKRVEDRWQKQTESHDLKLTSFDGGLELRAAAFDKGGVITEILKELGRSDPVAYLGDDITDEDAFLALANRGLRALVRPEFRTTNADLWIKPPAGLLAFFDRWLAAATGAGGTIE